MNNFLIFPCDILCISVDGYMGRASHIMAAPYVDRTEEWEYYTIEPYNHIRIFSNKQGGATHQTFPMDRAHTKRCQMKMIQAIVHNHLFEDGKKSFSDIISIKETFEFVDEQFDGCLIDYVIDAKAEVAKVVRKLCELYKVEYTE